MKIEMIKIREVPSPRYSSPNAAGIDLYTPKNRLDWVFRPEANGFFVSIPSGLQLRIPDGFYGSIHERSSVFMLYKTIFRGVVDSYYRGEIILQGFCFDEYPPCFEIGERVAQLIISPCLQGWGPKEVGFFSPETVFTKNQGFGSSGRH